MQHQDHHSADLRRHAHEQLPNIERPRACLHQYLYPLPSLGQIAYASVELLPREREQPTTIHRKFIPPYSPNPRSTVEHHIRDILGCMVEALQHVNVTSSCGIYVSG